MHYTQTGGIIVLDQDSLREKDIYGLLVQYDVH